MTVHIATVALSLHLAAHSGTCVLLGLELFFAWPSRSYFGRVMNLQDRLLTYLHVHSSVNPSTHYLVYYDLDRSS